MTEQLHVPGNHDQILLTETPENRWLCDLLELPMSAVWNGRSGLIRVSGDRLVRIRFSQSSTMPSTLKAGTRVYNGIVLELTSLNHGVIFTEEFTFHDFLRSGDRAIDPLLVSRADAPTVTVRQAIHSPNDLFWFSHAGETAIDPAGIVRLRQGFMHVLGLLLPESHADHPLTNRLVARTPVPTEAGDVDDLAMEPVVITDGS